RGRHARRRLRPSVRDLGAHAPALALVAPRRRFKFRRNVLYAARAPSQLRRSSYPMANRTHPKDALFAGEKPFPIINTCEHFAGSEKLITKAMELQQKMGPVFDITMDCEDGAKEGQEKQHAQMVVDVAKSKANV